MNKITSSHNRIIFDKKDAIIMMILGLVFLFFAAFGIQYETLLADEPGISLFPVEVISGDSMPVETEALLLGIFPTNYKQPYAFQLTSYYLLLVFSVFGISALNLKLAAVFLALVMLVVFYISVKYYFNSTVAFIMLLLLSTCPKYIQFSRIAIQAQEFTISGLISIAFLFFALYRHSKKNVYLYLAAFVSGLTLSVKISAIAVFIGIIMAAIIIYAKKVLKGLLGIQRKKMLIFGLFFLMGTSLFLYYNLHTKGKTFELIKYVSSDYRISKGLPELTGNSSYALNIKKRWRQLNNFISSKHYHEKIANNVLLFIFILSLPMNIVFAVKQKEKAFIDRILFIDIMFFTIFLLSGLSPESLSSLHLGILYPFPHISIAIFLYYFSSRNSNKIAKSFVISIISTIIVFNVLINYSFHYKYKKDQGYYRAHKEMLEYISKEAPVVCMSPSWEISTDINLNTAYLDLDIMWSPNPKSLQDSRQEFFKRGIKYVYCVQGGKNLVYGDNYKQWFENYLESYAKDIMSIQKFPVSDGKIMYYVYELRFSE